MGRGRWGVLVKIFSRVRIFGIRVHWLSKTAGGRYRAMGCLCFCTIRYGFIQRDIAFARLALDGVGLRGKAVYTHKGMLGISSGSLVAHYPLRKLSSDN